VEVGDTHWRTAAEADMDVLGLDDKMRLWTSPGLKLFFAFGAIAGSFLYPKLLEKHIEQAAANPILIFVGALGRPPEPEPP
jgi:hypothetical protein